MVNRRQFCLSAGMAAVASTGTVVGQTTAQQEIRVSGRVRSEVNADPESTTIEIFKTSDPSQSLQATIESDGQFSGSLPGTGTYQLVYINQTSTAELITEQNDLPLVYYFTEMEITDGGDLGEFVLPEGEPISIRCVDTDGRPIENLPVNFRAANGFGVQPDAFTTNPEGYVQFSDASEPGIELAGNTTIEIRPQSGSPVQLREISITEQINLRLTVTNPSQYQNVEINSESTSDDQSSGTVSARPSEKTSAQPSRTTGAPGRQRGFFSNSGNEPAFLSNPINLTMVGFLLSVAGIIHQMIGGK